jgi:uncharacterized membrane protein YhaH (DUF805 family)
MDWYLAVLKKYAVFSGRARRKEYWMFYLFNMIFAFAAIILDMILGTASDRIGYGFFYMIYMLAVFLPSLGLSVRRLHDVEKSGWFFLIGLIPLIGAIWLFVLTCTNGTVGINKYGPDPKAYV